jgi:hypothetical protein
MMAGPDERQPRADVLSYLSIIHVLSIDTVATPLGTQAQVDPMRRHNPITLQMPIAKTKCGSISHGMGLREAGPSASLIK